MYHKKGYRKIKQLRTGLSSNVELIGHTSTNISVCYFIILTNTLTIIYISKQNPIV